MGQSETKDSKVPLQTFTADVEEIGDIQSHQFGNVQIVRDKKTGQEFYRKKIVLQKKEAFDAQLLYYYTRLNTHHPSLINVVGYTSQEEKAFCSEQYKIFLYLDSLHRDMETELQERIKNKDFISEIELQLLSQHLISILAEFQKKGVYHGDICPASIFVTDEAYKLCDPTFESQGGSNAIAQAILLGGGRALLAPELLKQVPNQDFEIKTNKYKADVYSLGATLLSLATLIRSEDLYNYEQGTIDFALLDSRLKQIEGLYSPVFNHFLRDLLTFEESKRPDFIQLVDKLSMEESLRFIFEKKNGASVSKVPYVRIAKTLTVVPEVVQQGTYNPENFSNQQRQSSPKKIFS